jgi:hypothetical protein
MGEIALDLNELREKNPEAHAVLVDLVSRATGEPPKKIGDGKILAFLQKIIPLLVQFAPLFLETRDDSLEVIDRKIGDGTLLTVLLSALANPNFVSSLAALIALFKKPATA